MPDRLSLLYSGVVGFLFGALCGFLKLPLPARTALEGIVAIAGLWAGFKLIGG